MPENVPNKKKVISKTEVLSGEQVAEIVAELYTQVPAQFGCHLVESNIDARNAVDS